MFQKIELKLQEKKETFSANQLQSLKQEVKVFLSVQRDNRWCLRLSDTHVNVLLWLVWVWQHHAKYVTHRLQVTVTVPRDSKLLLYCQCRDVHLKVTNVHFIKHSFILFVRGIKWPVEGLVCHITVESWLWLWIWLSSVSQYVWLHLR